MGLTRMIEAAASTVDRAHTSEARRFNDREQRALLAHVASADPIDAEAALSVLSADAEMPMTEASPDRSFWMPDPRPMWLPADEPFRVQLRAAAAARAGVSTRPTATRSVAEVGPRPKPNVRRYAVLLIDAEYSGSRWADDIDREKRAMAAVLAQANRESLPVFEITWPDEGFVTDGSLAALRRADNWVTVEKTSRNGFAGTNLADELRARGITDVVVMGLYQYQCVEATVSSAASIGLRVHTSPSLLQAYPWAKDTTFRGWKAAPDANIVEDVRDLPIFTR